MRIGIFGGVFNPPHLGHLMIARQVLDFTDIEEIWFLPNYGQHPPKPHVAPVADRLAMTKYLKMSGTVVSTLEIDRKLDGNTINLLPHLPPKHSYTFIMGADWLPGFTTKWSHWEELLNQIPFLIFPRGGYANAPLYKNMTLLEHTSLMISNISSTKIRERARQGLSIDAFVPPAVATYIKKHGLYRS
ncbi:MAG: nicotinate (nicotinamide) nucleotide adenylyltransferase [Candidatus Gottesmanbacteria bacterium]|nr:nicotinate (nicotinamide) nucleotide adenylyltransferase [Candidatus Gottesmanbacteria bacterium]